jgi:alcohol dehydrogenase
MVTLTVVGTDFYQFCLKTKILFQAGISKDFSNELGQFSIRKFFIVSDPFLVESGIVRTIQEGIENEGLQVVGVYKDIPPNSEVSVVEACAAQAKKSGAEGLIAIGGGSVMDTAKAANVIFSLGGNLVEDYSGSQTIPHALKPLVAIPTTAGTGSEVSSSAVILDQKSHVKLSFNDSFLQPDLAILDPELTLSVPPKLTAMTGMDAFTHAIESYTSVQANPMSDAMAMKALKLIHRSLLRCVEQGSDLEARSHMLIAANMAGIAFEHAMVGVVHSMSHATGGIAQVPHGMANSILLPYGMEYNLPTSAGRYVGIAKRLGIDTSGMQPEEAARAAIKYVRELRAGLKKLCGLPDRLRDAGVQEAQLEAIARAAVEDGTSYFNPREVTYAEVLKKLKEAY